MRNACNLTVTKVIVFLTDRDILGEIHGRD